VLGQGHDPPAFCRAVDDRRGGQRLRWRVRAVLEVVPGIYDWRPLLLPSDAFFHPDEANAKHAQAEAAADFGGEIKYLIEER